MKFLKRFLRILLILVLLVFIFGWLYSKTYHPNYSGELELKNISAEVIVYFDDIGVPHINAQNQKDAYIALGYLHAQDRLWQMELMRRIAPGRLAEIFGKDLVRTDQFFQVGRHSRRRLISQPAAFGHHAMNHAADHIRQLLVLFFQRGRQGVQMLDGDAHRRGPRERCLAAQQLITRDAEGIDV